MSSRRQCESSHSRNSGMLSFHTPYDAGAEVLHDYREVSGNLRINHQDDALLLHVASADGQKRPYLSFTEEKYTMHHGIIVGYYFSASHISRAGIFL